MANILVISEKYWPEGGGAELATHLIVKYLSEDNFKVIVLTGTSHVQRISNVDYIYNPLLNYTRKVQLWANTLLLGKNAKFKRLIDNVDIVYLPGIAYPLLSFIRNKKTIVHLHNYQPIQYLQFIPAPYESYERLIGSPLLDYYMGKLEYEKRIYGLMAAFLALLNRVNKLIARKASLIICPSRRQANILTLKIPEVSERIIVIPNPPPPTTLTQYHNSKKFRTPTLVYVGGRSQIKGFKLACEVVKKLSSEMKLNAYLLGVQKSSNKVIVKNKGIIHLYPRMPHDEALKIVSRSWILLFTSITEEPFPYTVLEALFLGTPPIATNVGEVPEILEGTDAYRYMVKSFNIEDIVQKSKEVLSLPFEVFVKLSKSIMVQIKEKYSWRQIKEQYLNIFRRVDL
ncbi:MAG: glycosyltransferase family 4 protein [Candidatus Methanomethylicia archaeon]